jgi:IPT/TIG domain-containing protein/FG-GAP repeat protein
MARMTRSALARRVALPAILAAAMPSLASGGVLAHALIAHSSPTAPVTRSAESSLERFSELPAAAGPLVQQAQLAGAGEESGEGHLGVSVALSADGDTALVGAPDDGGGAGAAWVFTRSGATWTQSGPKLTAGAGTVACEAEAPDEEEPAECGFGKSVALSGNGETALVGEPGANGNLGAAWVFVRSGAGWTRQGPPLSGGAESPSAHFGRSVALSADGDTAIVGAPGDAGYKGAAWVFTRAGASWSEQAKLLAGGEGGVADFGLSVALSGDGRTALIGGPADGGGVGAAWVFTSDEHATWTQQSKFLGAGESGDGHFGYSVALSADAGTALVGERAHEGAVGAAWAFTGGGAMWSEPERLTAAEGGNLAKFGYSVALSVDGDTALVGDPAAFGSAGGAWAFTRSGTTFGPGEALRATGERGKGRLGSAVALAADGHTGLLGAPSDSARAGAAWSFVVPALAPLLTAVSPAEGPTGGGTEVTISGSNFGEAIAVEFGSVAARSFTVNAEGTSITAIAPEEAAGTVHVTVRSPNATSATSESDLFTFVAPAENGGQGEPQPTLPSGGNGPEPQVTVQSGSSGSGAAVQGAVLAFGPTTGPACAVSLLGKSAKVRKRARVALKLTWRRQTGTVSCRGELTLAVRVKRGGAAKRHRAVIIGVASFSIAPGGTKPIAVRLNAAGRARLRAAHGRLAVRLTITVSTPGPRRAFTRAIHLVSQGATGS